MESNQIELFELQFYELLFYDATENEENSRSKIKA